MSQCNNCGSSLTGTPKFCPSCGSPVELAAVPTNESKQVGGASKFRRASIVLGILLLSGLILYVIYINPSAHPVIKNQPVVDASIKYDTSFVMMSAVVFREEGSDLVFSLDELKSKKIVRFEYKTPTTVRPVLAYIAPDGRLVTAISVSEHCGSTEFKIKGNQLYCAHCPSHWDIMTMEAYACCGKYYPDPIPSSVVGNEVHIQKSVVEKWAGRL